MREQAGWPVCLTAWKWNPCCTRPPPAGAGGLACMLDCVEREPLLHAASPAGAGGLACPLGCAQRGPPVHAASPCGSRWVGLPARLRAKGTAGARGLPLREQVDWPVCLIACKGNCRCTRPPLAGAGGLACMLDCAEMEPLLHAASPAGAGGLACLLDCMQGGPRRTWPPCLRQIMRMEAACLAVGDGGHVLAAFAAVCAPGNGLPARLRAKGSRCTGLPCLQ